MLGQRVMVVKNGTSVPLQSEGYVIAQDHKRSTNGYDTLCLWEDEIGTKKPHHRMTWIPHDYLVVVQERKDVRQVLRAS